MSAHHKNGKGPCPLCDEKLKDAHPELQEWFREFVKPTWPQAHISWSYRNKEDQEKAFLDGKSKLHFPLSPHNKHDDQGNPCSMALDLFQLDFNGLARWGWAFFREISEAAFTTPNGVHVKWGGDWKTLGDADHYELAKADDA